MKLNFLLTLCLVGFFAVSSQAQINKDDLVGPWHLSMEKMLQNAPADKKAKATAKQEMMALVFGNVSVEFMQDGSTKIGGMIASMGAKKDKNKTIKGSWKIEGDRLITIDNMGKEKSEKIVKLTPDILIMEDNKKPDQHIYFVSLKKTIKDLKKTNVVKINKKKVAGTWKAVAVHKKGMPILLGIKYVFGKDGNITLKTPLNNTLDKKGTWKVTGNDKLQLTAEKKGKTKVTSISILYFTDDQMVGRDDKKGEKILFERVR